MNYKLLLPSYRGRQCWVAARAAEAARDRGVVRAVDLGAGEGELDRVLAPHVAQLDACDIHEVDVQTARRLNRDLPHVTYSVQDAQRTNYPSARYDLAGCFEVIEHVGDPQALLAELARLLRPGGILLLTCPSADFPWTYDPLNRLGRFWGVTLPMGAYGYGHDWLLQAEQMRTWLADSGFELRREDRLSHHLVGLCEMYVPGAMQRLLKVNSGNRRAAAAQAASPSYRPVPDAGTPPLLAWTDRLNQLDTRWFGRSAHSIGLGYVAVRR